MSKSLLDFSDYLQENNPAFLAAYMAGNEADFCAAVVQALSQAFDSMESSAKQLATQDELGLSLYLGNLLRAMMFPAINEGYSKGHADLHVRSPTPKSYLVLCECKKWNGNKYHTDGCGQLLGYMTGRHKYGVLIEFFDIAKMYVLLAKLKEYFDANKPNAQTGVTVGLSELKGAFQSNHDHSSGEVISVNHVGCNLYT